MVAIAVNRMELVNEVDIVKVVDTVKAINAVKAQQTPVLDNLLTAERVKGRHALTIKFVLSVSRESLETRPC